MTCRNNLWLIYFTLLFVVKSQLVFCGEPKVPCFFIFGDSLIDNGNNNRISTVAKSNHRPYGIDFRDGPTGRFTNGRTRVDIISQLLGFDDFIPPHATASGNAILKGVNYGSGASGILEMTGLQAGMVFSFKEQLLNHKKIVSKINVLQNNSTFTKEYLSKCLYTVGFGSNDYINNYLKPEFYPSSHMFTPEEYATRLIENYKTQLETLYTLGARKVAIFSLGLIGCTPYQIQNSGPGGSACAESTNNLVRLFDNQLPPLVQDLNRKFPDAHFTLLNMTSIYTGVLPAAGIEVADKPCCKVSKISGLCKRLSKPCIDRNKYAFYDLYHPTDVANSWTATRAYTAHSPSDAYPVDICHLIQL